MKRVVVGVVVRGACDNGGGGQGWGDGDIVAVVVDIGVN